MKIVDLIGIGLIVLGIAMTVMNFRGSRWHGADMQSFTVHELESPRSEVAPRGRGNKL